MWLKNYVLVHLTTELSELTLVFLRRLDGHFNRDFDHDLPAHALNYIWTLFEEVRSQVPLGSWFDCAHRHGSRLLAAAVERGGVHDEPVKSLWQPLHDPSAASNYL